MAVTLASFRRVFPEFGDTAKYSDPAVTFWLDQAGVTLNSGVPAGQLDMATMLFIAHNLTLGTLSAAGGGGAGSFAPTTSKSVGSVSKSSDVSLATSANAGIYNGTAYGQRLWALLRGLATGGFYRPSARAASLRYAETFGVYPR